MTASPTVTIDVMHDNSTYLSAHLLTPATPFWAKAVASALKGLRVPMHAAITFRRRGVVIRTSRLDFICRENS